MAVFAGTAFINILPDFKAFAGAMAKGVTAQQKTLTKVGKNMTKFITLPILAAAAASVKLAVDFEKTMTQIQSLAGQSQQQVSAWGKEILELAPKLGRAPQELAEALYFVASSGIEASKAMEVVVVSAKAAAVGLGDTQVVADAVTSAMNAYSTSGLSAAEATDVLTEAVRLGKGEAAAIAPVLGQILPTASELGVEFHEVAAGLASMTLIGTDAAESATRLRAIFSSLLKVTPASAEAFENVGLSVDDLRKSLESEGLLATMIKIKTAVGDDTDALAEMFPNVRALQGVLALVGNNGENVVRVFKDMEDTTHALDKAFEIVQEDSAFKLDQTLAQLKVTAIEFGDVLLPVVMGIAGAFGDFFEVLADLSPEMKELVVNLAGILAVVGPLLYILGKMPAAFNAIKKTISNLSFVTNPWFLMITGLVLAIYAFNKAMHASTEEQRAFMTRMDEVADAFVEALGRMTDATQVAEGALRVRLRALLDPVLEMLNKEDANELFGKFVEGGVANLKDFDENIRKTMGVTSEDIAMRMNAEAIAAGDAIVAAHEGQSERIKAATAATTQAIAQAFRQGNVTADQAILGFQEWGVEGDELRNRMLSLAGSMETFDVTTLVEGLSDAGVLGSELNLTLVGLIDTMAHKGTMTTVEYTDAMLKAGVPMRTIRGNLLALDSQFTDTAANISATGEVIKVFTFDSAKDFEDWATDIQESFESFVTGNTKFKEAFKLTTKVLKKQMEEQVKIAQQGAEDLKLLTELKAPPEFIQFATEQGPAFIHAFVTGSKGDREALMNYWKDIDEAVGDHENTLNDLGGLEVKTTIDADTLPARQEIEKLHDDLTAMGFILTDQNNFSLGGGQEQHGGGAAGQGRWRKGPLKSDEVPSILQEGEYVVQKKIASSPGMMKFLEALNQGRGIGEFHTGGAISVNSSSIRSNKAGMQSLLNAVTDLTSQYMNPPTHTGKVGANLPTADKLIEQLIAQAVPGGAGNISPNAARYAGVINSVFGNLPMGFVSRRNVAGTTSWSQHAFGNAVDVMTGANTGLRQAVSAFSDVHRELLSIAHLLADPWFKSPRGDHYNHVHADFNPQGTGTPPPGGGWIGARRGYHGRLSQDTNIRAHAGERVDISPRGSKPLTLRILDWKNGIAELAGEIDWHDSRGGR